MMPLRHRNERLIVSDTRSVLLLYLRNEFALSLSPSLHRSCIPLAISLTLQHCWLDVLVGFPFTWARACSFRVEFPLEQEGNQLFIDLHDHLSQLIVFMLNPRHVQQLVWRRLRVFKKLILKLRGARRINTIAKATTWFKDGMVIFDHIIVWWRKPTSQRSWRRYW